jgi:hypothetical protein
VTKMILSLLLCAYATLGSDQVMQGIQSAVLTPGQIGAVLSSLQIEATTEQIAIAVQAQAAGMQQAAAAVAQQVAATGAPADQVQAQVMQMIMTMIGSGAYTQQMVTTLTSAGVSINALQEAGLGQFVSSYIATLQAAMAAAQQPQTGPEDHCFDVSREDPDRFFTPISADGIIGYGTETNNADPLKCSTLPEDIQLTGPISDLVPDLRGTYVNDDGECEDDEGNYLRIEQKGFEINFLASGVIHHFKAEAAGCKPVTVDFRANCVGHNFATLQANRLLARQCEAVATTTPNKGTGCWVHSTTAVGEAHWCLTETGVSRQIGDFPAQTFTRVSTE